MSSEPLKRNFVIQTIESTGERYCHFPNTETESDRDLDYEDDNPVITGTLPENQCIPLKHVLDLLAKENIDSKDVYFTASFSDDHLCLEIVHIKKLNDDEQDKDYKDQCAEWEKEQARIKRERLEIIEQQMSSLKKQAERLKK